MTDGSLMDAFCAHGQYWDECIACEAILPLQFEINRLEDFLGRVMEELDKHGWGDFHYGPQPQDPAIVKLKEEYNASKR